MNQPPLFLDVDLLACDLPLREALHAAGVDSHSEDLAALGRWCGSAEAQDLGRLANENPPRLRRFDARGDPLDLVEYHPAYHELMRRSMQAGLHVAEPGVRAAVARAARLYLATQAESGHICPLTMTHASVAALDAAPELLGAWRPGLMARTYDPSFRPWWLKEAVTVGMGMTERQGGTDVRANVTAAEPAGDHYRINGHKWFMSAPMCDAFLVLAQAPGGLTCFLMPRFEPDGRPNGLHLDRLKDKLGNRANASSEVRFERAFAERVGTEGEGVRTIIGMVQLTRLDCVISSAALMRFGLGHAVHNARHRSVFQRLLVDQPAMTAVLADLALEVEAAVALAFRLAAAFGAPEDPDESAYARLVTPAAKFLVCKAAPGFLAECMEALGGNGYVEDYPLARAYREAPVNAIWEGSGNVMALDVLRAIRRAPDAAARLLTRLAAGAGPDGREAARTAAALAGSAEGERHARRVAETLARLAAAAALRERHPAFAEAYESARLGPGSPQSWGATDLAVRHEVLARVLPG